MRDEGFENYVMKITQDIHDSVMQDSFLYITVMISRFTPLVGFTLSLYSLL